MVAVGLLLSVAISLVSTANAYVIKIDHHDGTVKEYDIPNSNLTAEEFLSNPEPVKYRRDLDSRQLDSENPFCQGTDSYFYTLVGDGNPHQNYKIAQVEGTLTSCSPGATVQTGHEHTFSWSISASISAPGQYSFGSVGFSVGESDTQTVQQSFTCGGNGMTEICAMHYTAVTAVTVEFWYRRDDNCGNYKDTSQGIGTVYLPNANGVGSVMARGVNFGNRNIIQCRGDATREIDFFCGPAGGPDFFFTTALGPWGDAYMAGIQPSDCYVPIEALQFLD